MRRLSLLAVCVGFVLTACGGGAAPPDDGGGVEAGSDMGVRDASADAGHGDGSGPDAGSGCTSALVCDDGVFCNGAERCAPGTTGADPRGCAPGDSPCAAGQVCDEGMLLCTTACATSGDADGDGHASVACGGDDCDDSDPNRHPMNPEVCDTANHDEDCNPLTFGNRDLDHDGAPDANCCNVDSAGAMHCGTDCNDAARTIAPGAPELCDLLDNNCNGTVDEGVLHHYFVDADGDTYGDASDTTGMDACFPPPGYVADHTDCDDTTAAVSPAASEVCDAAMVDENCDGIANPATLCACSGTATRPCSAAGACSAGIETCGGGMWGMCSVAPVTETCNGIDDDCNGVVDDGLRVLCYADADNDGYPASGAASSMQCAAPGRAAVGGCPPTFTNRAPAGTSIDCDDGNSTVHPGAAEICVAGAPPVDENCNGLSDEGVGVDCFADADDDSYAASGASAQHQCIDLSRPGVGGCPFRFTNRMPTGSAIDCDDLHPQVHPGGTEVCDAAMLDENCDGVANPPALCACVTGATRACPDPGPCAAGIENCVSGAWTPCSIAPVPEICNMIDDDCNGVVDNGVLTTCYADGDGDGYAAAGASPTMLCGTCAVGQTTNAPTSGNVDCNDGDGAVHPGVIEVCDRIDSDCSAGGGVETSEDFDNDGHASPSAVCTGGFPKDDCADRLAGVHPGVGAWFSVPYCPECRSGPACVSCADLVTPVLTSFDYNCDGAEQPHPADATCTMGTSCFGGCGTSSFAYTGRAPSCGTPAAYHTCGCALLCTSSSSTMPLSCH